MSKLIIVGTSTTAKSVHYFVTHYKLFDVLGFAVNARYRNIDNYCGLPVYDLENLPEEFNKEQDYLFIAIQWNRLNADRRDVFNNLTAQGYKLANLISPNAIVHSDLSGTNCWVCDSVIIEPDVNIQDNVFFKTNAAIASYSNVESHSFVGANSFIAGDVTIGEQSFIGISSTIFDCVKIGKKCLVGGGVILKRSIPDYTIVKSSNESATIIASTSEEIEGKLMFSKNIR